MQLHLGTLLAAIPLLVAGVASAGPPASIAAKVVVAPVADEEMGLRPEEALGKLEAAPAHSGIVWGDAPADYRSCDFARAGNPQCLSRRTIPSNTRYYGGYYVGGGTPCKGAGHCDGEGTWGWDYSGILFPKRIALNWTHNTRYQGGTGTYKTDGPKLKHE